LIAAFRHAPRTPGVYAALALGLTVYGSIRLWTGRKQLKQLRLGRDGERAVGQFLEALRVDGARIFHDIPGDKFNLDHVVLAEQGIFVIETKTRTTPNSKSSVVFDSDQILIAGHASDRDPVTQSASQVRWLQQLIKESTGKDFPVRGVVVFPGWFVERTEEAMKSNLWVLEPKAQPSFIDHESKRLTPSDVALAAYHRSRFIRAA
jgi:Nuclease-related domain